MNGEGSSSVSLCWWQSLAIFCANPSLHQCYEVEGSRKTFLWSFRNVFSHPEINSSPFFSSNRQLDILQYFPFCGGHSSQFSKYFPKTGPQSQFDGWCQLTQWGVSKSRRAVENKQFLTGNSVGLKKSEFGRRFCWLSLIFSWLWHFGRISVSKSREEEVRKLLMSRGRSRRRSTSYSRLWYWRPKKRRRDEPKCQRFFGSNIFSLFGVFGRVRHTIAIGS